MRTRLFGVVGLTLWFVFSLYCPVFAETERSDDLSRIDRSSAPAPRDLAGRVQEEVPIPKLRLKGFTDLGFGVRFSGEKDQNSFSLGQVDLFITSEIASQVSFLVETVFEFDSRTNGEEFDLERVHLSYFLSDAFKIKIGRMHTPLGYWNQAFHHGTWLQTTIHRPEIYLFEDRGGILPVHSIGVEFYGLKDLGRMDIEYNLGILNGRGRVITEIQQVKDKNDSKALNVLFSISPHFLDGLRFGGNFYYDVIPGDPGNVSRKEKIKEFITGAHLIYLSGPVELLAELFRVRHDDRTLNRNFASLGYYLQMGYRIHRHLPYYRLDFMNLADQDPFLIPSKSMDRIVHTVGVRWDIFSWNALKLEYGLDDLKNSRDEHSVSFNSSFTF